MSYLCKYFKEEVIMNNSIKMISPFVLYCQKVIPLAFDESMSYYECLCALYSYLKDTVVPAVNNNADALEEVQKAMAELKEYVDTYFDNLDIQTEVNNKLDEMAESGELAEIIAQFLEMQFIYGFDTISDMQGGDNYVEGSIVKTLGESAYDDGKGAFYRIRQLRIDDVIDEVNIVSLTNFPSLVAEKIPIDISQFVDLDDYVTYNAEKLTELKCEYNEDIKCYYELLKLKKDKFSLSQLYESEYPNGIYDYLKNTENCFYMNGVSVSIKYVDIDRNIVIRRNVLCILVNCNRHYGSQECFIIAVTVHVRKQITESAWRIIPVAVCEHIVQVLFPESLRIQPLRNCLIIGCQLLCIDFQCCRRRSFNRFGCRFGSRFRRRFSCGCRRGRLIQLLLFHNTENGRCKQCGRCKYN